MYIYTNLSFSWSMWHGSFIHDMTHSYLTHHMSPYSPGHCPHRQRASPCKTLQDTARHCKTLQDTATNCNTLQHTATHCNTLQHTSRHCKTLQDIARHCRTLQQGDLSGLPPRREYAVCLPFLLWQGVAVRCSVLQCVAVCCSVSQCIAVCCRALQFAAVCCSVSPGHHPHREYEVYLPFSKVSRPVTTCPPVIDISITHWVHDMRIWVCDMEIWVHYMVIWNLDSKDVQHPYWVGIE